MQTQAAPKQYRGQTHGLNPANMRLNRKTIAGGGAQESEHHGEPERIAAAEAVTRGLTGKLRQRLRHTFDVTGKDIHQGKR
jgi:hypothetical protein